MNEMKSQPSGRDSAPLEARIERIRQTLAAQQARLARGAMITASIGAILCVLMAVYFYIGYSKIRSVATPKMIVAAAESVVLDTLPSARRDLEKEINGSADEWAADVSQQVQDHIPELREKTEEFIVEKVDETLDQFQVLTQQQFRTFVANNQAMLSDGFRSLKKPDEAERFVHDLHVAIAQQMSGDIREQSEDMLHTVIDLNAKLEKLQKGERLNAEQAIEREILMIARRLQIESQGELATRPKRERTPRGEMASEPETVAAADAAGGDAGKSESAAKDATEPAKVEAPEKVADKPAEKPAVKAEPEKSGDKPAEPAKKEEAKESAAADK